MHFLKIGYVPPPLRSQTIYVPPLLPLRLDHAGNVHEADLSIAEVGVGLLHKHTPRPEPQGSKILARTPGGGHLSLLLLQIILFPSLAQVLLRLGSFWRFDYSITEEDPPSGQCYTRFRFGPQSIHSMKNRNPGKFSRSLMICVRLCIIQPFTAICKFSVQAKIAYRMQFIDLAFMSQMTSTLCYAPSGKVWSTNSVCFR